MSMFQMMGLADKRILTGGYCIDGRITEVKACHWLKVNTKSARLTIVATPVPSGLNVTFVQDDSGVYTVDSKEYHGTRFVNWNDRCPVKDEIITVYYDAENPAKYAVLI